MPISPVARLAFFTVACMLCGAFEAAAQQQEIRVSSLHIGITIQSNDLTSVRLLNDTQETVTLFLFAFDTRHRIFREVNVSAGGLPLAPSYYRYHFAQQFIVYSVSLQAGSDLTLNIEALQGAHTGLVMHPELIPQQIPVLLHESKGNLLELALCSMVFMMGLYILLKYVQLRTKEYGFYALYIFFTFLHFGVVLMAKSWASWYQNPEERVFYHRLFQLLSHAAYFQFFRHFTHTPVQQPLFDRVLRGATWAALGLAAIDFVLAFALQPLAFPYDLTWTIVRIGFSLFVIVSLALWVSQSASPLRKYLIAGNSFLIAGGALTMMWNAYPEQIENWSGPFSYSLFYFRLGVLFELLFFSLGLGFKQRLDEQRRQEAEARLERDRLALEKAREVDAAKSAFFANISHEFRTPLALIQGPAEKIARDSNGAYQYETDLIVNNSRALLRLVDQILELSKLEAGKWKLQVEALSLNAFFTRITEAFYWLAQQKSQQFQLQLPATEGQVWLDPYLVEAMVQNLVSNAHKYTPVGGTVALRIRWEQAHLFFEVQDTGRGIAAEQLPFIFDRYYRVPGTAEPGAGVGLTLVRELVRLHKGTIAVNSTPGEGTSFAVQLPCDLAQYLPSEQKTHPTIDATPAVAYELDDSNPDRVRLPTVLIVEDQPALQTFLGEVLKTDYQILKVADAATGWITALEQLPDLIITDWMLPGESGLDLCRKIKGHEITNHIPVVILTARASPQARLQGWETGADDYLTKPFEVDELRLRLRNLIQQRQTLRAKFQSGEQAVPTDQPMRSVFLLKVEQAIRNHLSSSSFSVEQLAREVGVSRVQLHRKLVALTGHGASDLIRHLRLQQADSLLREGELGVAEVAYATGFESASHFARVYRERYQVAPSATRTAGKGKNET